MTNNKRKQKIIDAAVEVMKNCPIEDLTMRKIASSAGLTTGALYYHYKNKDELLLDVMRHSLHFTPKLYEETMIKENHIGEKLLNEVNTEVAGRLRKIEHQTLHIQFFSDMLKQKTSLKSEYRSQYESMINYTAELLNKAFLLAPSEYDKSIASILVAAVDGIAMQQSLDVLPEDLDKTIEVFISFFNSAIPHFLKKNN